MAYVLPDCRDRRLRESPRIEQSRGLQVLDRRRDVPPRGLLHEQCADDDLERGAGRPPVLRAILAEQPLVDFSGPIHSSHEMAVRTMSVIGGARI